MDCEKWRLEFYGRVISDGPSSFIENQVGFGAASVRWMMNGISPSPDRDKTVVE